jgi:hypothetical protein
MMTQPTLFDLGPKKTVKMGPTQADTVLKHMQLNRAITPMVAITTYGIFRLAPAVHVLRRRGYKIKTTMYKDMVGKQYAAYRLV